MAAARLVCEHEPRQQRMRLIRRRAGAARCTIAMSAAHRQEARARCVAARRRGTTPRYARRRLAPSRSPPSAGPPRRAHGRRCAAAFGRAPANDSTLGARRSVTSSTRNRRCVIVVQRRERRILVGRVGNESRRSAPFRWPTTGGRSRCTERGLAAVPALLPDLVLLPRDELLRHPARHRPHRRRRPVAANHPDGELIVELVQRDDGLVRPSDACTRQRSASRSSRSLQPDVRARARSASAKARS